MRLRGHKSCCARTRWNNEAARPASAADTRHESELATATERMTHREPYYTHDHGFQGGRVDFTGHKSWLKIPIQLIWGDPHRLNSVFRTLSPAPA